MVYISFVDMFELNVPSPSHADTVVTTTATQLPVLQSLFLQGNDGEDANPGE